MSRNLRLAAVIALLSLLLPATTIVGASTGSVLQNGSFEATGTGWLAPWYFKVRTGAAGTILQTSSSRVDGTYAAQVNVTTSSPSAYLLQLSQDRVPLAAGQTYTISFSARASAARSIEVVLQQVASPYTVFLSRTVGLTTSWQRFAFSYTSPVTSTDRSLHFNLAASPATVYLDAVGVIPTTASTPTTASPTPTQVSPSTPPPTPTGTPPAAPSVAPAAPSVTFAIFGDSAGATSTSGPTSQLKTRAGEYKFILHTGDSTTSATSYSAYTSKVWNVYGTLFQGQGRAPGPLTSGTPKPLWATPGNHDYEFNPATYFKQSFATGGYNGPAVGGVFYSKEPVPGLHVVMFDSHWITGGWGDTYVKGRTQAEIDAVKAWLIADLDAHRNEVTIVVEHEPGYPISSQHPFSENPSVRMRSTWYPLFRDHGVDLVVSGHDHAYQRQDPAVTGLHSYVNPSSGQGLYSVTPASWDLAWLNEQGFMEVTVAGGRITTRLIRANGAIFDQYTYTAPSWVAP